MTEYLFSLLYNQLHEKNTMIITQKCDLDIITPTCKYCVNLRISRNFTIIILISTPSPKKKPRELNRVHRYPSKSNAQ